MYGSTFIISSPIFITTGFSVLLKTAVVSPGKDTESLGTNLYLNLLLEFLSLSIKMRVSES